MRSDNPYHADGFIDPGHRHYSELYIQRSGLEEVIISRLEKYERPFGSYIFGPRQSGKTSLLYHLKAHQQNAVWSCALLTLSPLQKNNEHIWFEGLWKNLVRQLKIHKEDPVPQNANQFEVRLREVAPKVSGLRVLIMLEEIDTLIPSDPNDDLWIQFLVMLRSLDQGRGPGLEKWVFVLGAYRDPDALYSKMQRDWIEKVSPMFNTIKPLRLEDWGLDGTVRLAELLALAHSMNDDVPQRVHDWTNGHPYLTQRVLSILYDSEGEHLTSNHVDEAADHLLGDPHDSNLVHIANHLRNFDQRTKSVLLQSLDPKRCRWNESSKEQKELHTLGLITKSGDAPKSAIMRNRIYERYVKAYYPELLRLDKPVCFAPPSYPNLFTQVFVTVLLPLLIGLLVWYVFSAPAAAPWKLMLSRILTSKAQFLLLIPVEILAGIAVGLVTYLVFYTFIWLTNVPARSEAKTLRLRQSNPEVPPLALEFDAVASNNAEWKLNIRLEDTTWPYPAEIKAKSSDRVTWKSAEYGLDASERRGELAASLTRAFNWKALLLPWPDKWIVSLEVEWSSYSVPVELHIVADASEAWPRLLTTPFSWLLSIVSKVIESKAVGKGNP